MFNLKPDTQTVVEISKAQTSISHTLVIIITESNVLTCIFCAVESCFRAAEDRDAHVQYKSSLITAGGHRFSNLKYELSFLCCSLVLSRLLCFLTPLYIAASHSHISPLLLDEVSLSLSHTAASWSPAVIYGPHIRCSIAHLLSEVSHWSQKSCSESTHSAQLEIYALELLHHHQQQGHTLIHSLSSDKRHWFHSVSMANTVFAQIH